MQLTNCHVHTFTHEHVPDRFVPSPLAFALRFRPFRRALFALVRLFARRRRTRLARYCQILEVSYDGTQETVFEKVRSFYPYGSRFIVLPMDMELMGAGNVKEPLQEQPAALRALAEQHSGLLIPFAAVDARRPNIVEDTKPLLLEDGFRGIKLYPPLGYHPNDRELQSLYGFAAERGFPVMTHCSRPAGVTYRGPATERMRRDPVTGERLDPQPLRAADPLHRLGQLCPDPGCEPGAPLMPGPLRRSRRLALLLHEPLAPRQPPDQEELAREGPGPRQVRRLRPPLHGHRVHGLRGRGVRSPAQSAAFDESVSSRVLFGSDFYVVENAELEERRIALRVRSLLGEELFWKIAHDNPKAYLGEA